MAPEQAEFHHLAEAQLYRGHVISLGRVDVQGPDGQVFCRDVVHHPGAVAVVPLGDDGVVTLVRQYRVPAAAWVLETPAGTRDVDGEPPETTARRELEEEAGLRAGSVALLAQVLNSPGITDQETMVFVATGLEPCATGRQGVEARWMTTAQVHLDDVPDLVARGELRDAMTILALELLRGSGVPGRRGP